MAAKQSPFFNINYGWAYNEDGWNVGMDENLTKLSFLGYKIVKDVVASLPSGAVDGDSYILSTNKSVYFMVDSQWNQITPSEGMSVYVVSYGYAVTYKDGDWTGSSSPSTGGITLKVAFIGDSLTQPSTRNFSWATQLCWFLEQLLGVKVLCKNAAIGGSTWDNAINTNQHEGGTKNQIQEVIDFAPDLVFAALGINDCVYGTGYTSSQVIANAQLIYTTLKTALPAATIIYCEEAPHNLSLGTTPTSLTNQDALPFSHSLIALNGLTNVRINNSTYLSTAVASGTLTRHQTWGSSTTSIRAIFDGYFTANLWKMARLGCMADSLHVDALGHCLWAWQAITYLASSGLSILGIPMSKINFSNLNGAVINIDALYTEFTNKSLAGNMPASYRGFSSFERAAGWMMYSPSAHMDADSALADASKPLTILISKASPNRNISTSVGSSAFIATGRTTSEQGTHLQTFIPSFAFPSMIFSGTYSLYFAVQNPDSTYDVFQKSITVSNPTVTPGAYALKRCDSNTSLTINTQNTLNFTTTLVDEVGVGSNFSRITIPSSLNNKKFKLKANVRLIVNTTSSDTSVRVFCGIKKNGLAATGNSLASGLGLPSHNIAANLDASGTQTYAFDANLASSILTGSTGDYFEVSVEVDKTSTDAVYQVASNYTWFSLEVV